MEDIQHSKIKLCGLRRPEDIEAVNAVKPDFAGFICCPRFWRSIPIETCRKLTAKLDPGIRSVGVFVDQPFEELAPYIRDHVVDMIQLHGSEDEYYIHQLRKVMVLHGNVLPIIKAIKVTCPADIMRARHSVADYVLLDGGTGTGQAFDWSLIADIGREYFLAGGLGPANVAQAVSAYHPYAVDISSGVETDRCKDPEKMQAAVRAVKAQAT